MDKGSVHQISEMRQAAAIPELCFLMPSVLLQKSPEGRTHLRPHVGGYAYLIYAENAQDPEGGFYILQSNLAHLEQIAGGMQ